MASVVTTTVRDGRADTRSFWDKTKDAWRSFSLSGWPRDPVLAQYFGLGSVAAGVSVSQTTALQVATLFCVVSTIAGDVAALPRRLYRTRPDGGREPFVGHPLYRVLHDAANATTTAFQFWQTMMFDLLTSGNAFAEIVRNGAGQVAELHHINAARIAPFFEEGTHKLKYRFHNYSGGDVIFDPSQLIHLRGVSPDTVLGFDVVFIARQVLGLSIAAETFAASYFQNGLQVGGVLESSGVLSEPVRKNLREALEKRHQGSNNAHQLLLLESGMKYNPTATNPRDSQFNELRIHQVREICRLYKFPPHKAADLADATFSNVEQENLSYYTSCLRPHLVNIEQECNLKLIASSERNQQVIEHSIEGLLRANSEARGQFYAVMVSNGLMSPNEIRKLENLPPVAGGDKLRVPLNTAPIDSQQE